MNTKLYIGLALLLLVVIFTVQNASVVTINFLIWNFSASRALVIFFVLVIGILIGWFAAGWQRHHKRR
jgi:putative membrane protein